MTEGPDSRPLRIAVWHNLLGGGGLRTLHLAARWLVARGHTIETFCPGSADRTSWPMAAVGPEHVFALPAAPRHGWQHAQWPAYSAAQDRLRVMEAHAAEAAKAIAAGKFDVLFAQPCQFLAAPAVVRHRPCPTALWLLEPCRRLYECGPGWVWHAPEPDARLGRWSPRRIKRGLENLMGAQGARLQAREEARNAAAADVLIANSRYSRESLLRAYGVDAEVCYPAVDLEVFRPTGVPRQDFVLGLGHLHPHKRPDRVIRAVATIPEARRPRVLWIGRLVSAPYHAEIEALAHALGVRFRLRQDVEDNSIRDALNEARALVFAPHLEPFGLAPLEALACGTPVVAIAEGGVRESLIDGETALLVDHDDPGALGAALRTLLDHPDEAAALGARGRAQVETTWGIEARGPAIEAALLRAAAAPHAAATGREGAAS